MIILLSPTKKQKRHQALETQENLLFEEKKNKVLNVLTNLDPKLQ